MFFVTSACFGVFSVAFFGVAPSLRPEGRRRGIDGVLRRSFIISLSVNELKKIFKDISRFPFIC